MKRKAYARTSGMPPMRERVRKTIPTHNPGVVSIRYASYEKKLTPVNANAMMEKSTRRKKMINKGDKVTYAYESWTVRDCKTIATQSGSVQQWLKLSQNEPPTRITQVFGQEVQEQTR